MNPEYIVVTQTQLLTKLKKMKLIAMPKEYLRPARNHIPFSRWQKGFTYVSDVDGGLSTGGWTKVNIDGSEYEFMLKYFGGCFLPHVIKKITFK